VQRRAAAVLLLAFMAASFRLGGAAPFPASAESSVTKDSGAGRKSDVDKAVEARKTASQDVAAGCKRPQSFPARRLIAALVLPEAAAPSPSAEGRAERTDPKYLRSFLRGTSSSRRDPPV
jgi:hypothetical protein